MSKLSTLIAELCPNGVEYKKLGEVSIMKRGSSLTKAQAHIGDIPVISGGKDPAFYCDFSNRDGEVITVAGSGAGAGYVQYWDIPIFANDCFTVQGKEFTNTKYLYYLLTNMQNRISATRKGAGIPHVHISDIENFEIPIPPLAVQSEIVRILDNFASLTAELTAELTARKKQYEYYRDELLKHLNDVPFVSIKEIKLSIYRGNGIKRDEVTKEGVPCVRYGEIYTTYNTWFNECVSHTNVDNIKNPKYFEYGDVLFAATGESVEEIAKSIVYIGNDKCLAGGDIIVLKHKQHPRYMAHILNTTMVRKQKSSGKIKSKVVHASVPSIEEIKIPLPPLDKQEYYAGILDNFEKLCFDLTEGLPSEIEAHQKQYEYYRNKLLNFKKSAKISI